ncbi:copper chaperone PCu(A)C [Alisedimentitalea sp. MJ-SS2]|uniref:copper chaperone PCu(A)C n=1 Tax=Aliisedimentitalea sp. MJ-SS2 TaxID=3049795 RepID=UPI0029121703|nr:copper chaperone PCu(A)C [Alisedimentitalea sp. MJ-SS2]MDU8928521.1 copper chaperone PCu(A)C [Alisedimentitalea sp. MJ-SS2]
MKRRVFLGVALVSMAMTGLPATAGDVTTDSLEISGAFSRASPKMAKAGAGFMTIRSLGPADTLLGFKSPACERPELHTHIKGEGGIMMMRKVEAIDIPAGGEAVLQPGSLHLMFIKLTEQLVEGQEIEATLIFEKAGEVKVTLPVKGPGAMK